ncbi:MAG: preprotein translocase subunit YajC [Paludibacteraceae bacterium]|nr:preprotein translocase subunit YajC [Paludibacteraceae bacterium]MBR4839968.1 preprotein translocase subunit YajC [Paludibacteraceae bacterium]
MNLYSILLQAQGGANAGIMNMLFIVLVIGAFWFLIMKPQRDQQKKLDTFRQSLCVGDKVMTNGGIYGVVKDIQGDKIVVEVAKDVQLTVSRMAVNPIQEEKADKTDKKK